ncbi:MAG: cobaltochelatase subunit CobN, partial [Giesbergeria sp.]
YLTAAYGGDPIRNPDSLPTGRNLTGLDPSRLPTRQAYEVAQRLFQQWLQDWRAAHGGSMPQRLALSLWAGETLRHQGVMEAQALVALGVRPVWDSSGRPQRVELIPQAQLGRERVDVLLSVTGSYRDQFPALMALIDQAVALAAGAEPANAVARNTAAVHSALRHAGVPAAQAQTLAQARSFGNQEGDYGTGLSDAVQDGRLRRDDPRLGEMFLQRMSQPFLHGEPVPGVARTHAVQALGAHLRQADAAVLSRSSHLYAMVSSDDPFQYLGGLAAAARAAGKKDALALYVSELHDSSEVHTESAQRNIAREMQSRYLHPGWLQAQQAEGYAGTLQVLKAVQFAWGWQAVAPDTIRPDHWQSFFDVLVKDRHQLGTPLWLRQHPQAYAQALERLVQASRLGHWQPDAATRTELARSYAELTQSAPLALELREVRQWVRQQTVAGPALAPRAESSPARGAGLEAPARAPASPPLPSVPRAAPPAAPPVVSGKAQPVTGMLLQAVQPPAPTHPGAAERKAQLLVLLGLLAVVLAGALRQWVRQRGLVLAVATH